MSRTPPDHIGWDLVRAARTWEAAFRSRLIDAGHPVFGEARSQLLEHIGRSGIAQADLTERSGLTKQAVAQHLDALEEEGLITRGADPSDARRRMVRFSKAGEEMLHTADRIKAEIEAEMAERLGHDRLHALKSVLKDYLEGRQDT